MLIRTLFLRVGTALITLLAVSVMIFAAVEVLPGDAASRVLGRFATEEAKERFRQQLHLDRPAYERYLIWIGGVVRGDFGHSLVSDTRVVDVAAPKVRNTMMLASYAFALYIPISLILSSLAALSRDKPLDSLISMLTLLGLSMPEFVMGTLLIFLFAIAIPVFPVMALVHLTKTPGEAIRTMTLPALTMAIAMAVYAIRMLRDNLIDVLESDYVRMATLKGLGRRQVLVKHALPNAIVPALNVTALNLAYLIGGVVVVEMVFAYPGVGKLLVESVFLRDAPTIEATVLLISSVYILANLVADLFAIALNPRLRTG